MKARSRYSAAATLVALVLAPAAAMADGAPKNAPKAAPNAAPGSSVGQTTLTRATVPGKPVDKKTQPTKAAAPKNAKPQEADAKKDEPKKDDAKPADAKKDEPKADDAKKDDAKKDDAKKDDAKKDDAAAADTVLVHVDSPSPVVLEQEDEPKSESFKPACESPCDKRLPTGTRYRIVPKDDQGDGMRPSKAFWLDTQRDSLTLEVKPSTKSDLTTGVIVTSAGGAVFLAGAITLIAGFANRNKEAPGIDGSVSDRSYTDTMWVGTGLAVGGLATAIVGGSLWVKSRNSQVVGGVQAPPPAKGQAPSTTRAAWAMPEVHNFSILRGSF